MTGCKGALRNFKAGRERKVTLADGKVTDAEESGAVIFSVQGENVDNRLTAKEVLYVPGILDSLFSISKLTGSGMEVTFSGGDCTVYKEGSFVFSGAKVEETYRARAEFVPVSDPADHAQSDDTLLAWVIRVLTRSSEQLKKMLWHGCQLYGEVQRAARTASWENSLVNFFKTSGSEVKEQVQSVP